MATLKKGSKGSAVRAAQEALNFHGAKPKLKIDGDFGPKTEAAVQQIQKEFKKLKPTAVNGRIDADMALSLTSKIPGRPLIKKWPLGDFMYASSNLHLHYRNVIRTKDDLLKRLEVIEKRGLGHTAIAFVKKKIIEGEFAKYQKAMRKKFDDIDKLVVQQAIFVKSSASKKGQLALQKAEVLDLKLPHDYARVPEGMDRVLKNMEREIKELEAEK